MQISLFSTSSSVDSVKRQQDVAAKFAGLEIKGSANTAQESAGAVTGTSLGDFFNTSAAQIDTQNMAGDNTDVSSSSATDTSAADEFRAFLKKDPIERMVDQILKSMGLTKEALEAMPPEQQKAVMDKIHKIIEDKIRQGTGVADGSGTVASAIGDV